jgi:membrane-anchored glycerophosphoryl diester phosphodiesterase (GDPDase)
MVAIVMLLQHKGIAIIGAVMRMVIAISRAALVDMTECGMHISLIVAAATIKSHNVACKHHCGVKHKQHKSRCYFQYASTLHHCLLQKIALG